MANPRPVWQHMSSIFPTLVECSVYCGYCSRRRLNHSDAGRSERMHPEGSLEQGTSTSSRHRSCQNDSLVHPRRSRISVTHHYPRFFNQHADSSAGVFPVDERHHMSSDDFNHAGFLQWLATDIILLPNPEPTEFSVVAPVDTVAAVATVNDISPRHPVLAARTSGSSGPASHVGCTPKPSIPRTSKPSLCFPANLVSGLNAAGGGGLGNGIWGREGAWQIWGNVGNGSGRESGRSDQAPELQRPTRARSNLTGLLAPRDRNRVYCLSRSCRVLFTTSPRNAGLCSGAVTQSTAVAKLCCTRRFGRAALRLHVSISCAPRLVQLVISSPSSSASGSGAPLPPIADTLLPEANRAGSFHLPIDREPKSPLIQGAGGSGRVPSDWRIFGPSELWTLHQTTERPLTDTGGQQTIDAPSTDDDNEPRSRGEIGGLELLVVGSRSSALRYPRATPSHGPELLLSRYLVALSNKVIEAQPGSHPGQGQIGACSVVADQGEPDLPVAFFTCKDAEWAQGQAQRALLKLQFGFVSCCLGQIMQSFRARHM
ncbi:hypothetical protein BKA56DRAFT_609575 [Ilyonectria sp. MPI-CAGE-AT-0026]|nr:hypothetical protein BKA56DRAFT_609575 [Ilyonectria sp. MPI-CAGE-AT-0026]